MTTDEYLYDTEETNRIRELAQGVVREPPAPFFSHQRLVLRLARIVADHVEPRQLGHVAIAPVDVILDREQAIVVQPDVLFVSKARLSIIRNPIERPSRGFQAIRSAVLPGLESSAAVIFAYPTLL